MQRWIKCASVEISSSFKAMWIEKVRKFPAFEIKEGQNNLVLGSSIVHKLALDDTIPLIVQFMLIRDLPRRKNKKSEKFEGRFLFSRMAPLAF